MLSVMHGVGAIQRAKERGFTEMASLYWNDDAGIGTQKYVEPRWKAMGGTVVASEARLILLDEPASGLDPKVMESLFPLVKDLVKFGKTICIVEPNMEVIRAMVDEIVFLNEGRVIARGTPEEIMNAPELAQIYFGIADGSKA
jgi:ABC-type branched-subunit amino acid transport system ATPase component